ncbi:NAD(+) diphosphatase [soil metagenome]
MPLSDTTNTFAGDLLDRVSEKRGDPAWIAERLADPDALALPLLNGQVMVEDVPGGGVRLAYAPLSDCMAAAPDAERRLFLGLWKSTPVWAFDFEAAPEASSLSSFGRFEEMRPFAMSAPGPEAAIAGRARAVFEWRRRHRFCANCGSPSDVVDGGWKRVCPACAAEHFPRVDPVTIMLIARGDRCLLGRQPRFPPGMFSALAGFVEPGESIEEACAREVKEESALTALTVRYHSSQPWPFPHSLMIGLICEVDQGEAVADPGELEEVRWFTRDDVRTMLKGELPGVFCPPPMAIAHQLIKAWAEG